jgi:hypothetical protein
VTVSGPSVTDYKYKGQGVTVGFMNAQIRMQRTGKKSANFFYKEPNGFANHTGVHLQ